MIMRCPRCGVVSNDRDACRECGAALSIGIDSNRTVFDFEGVNCIHGKPLTKTCDQCSASGRTVAPPKLMQEPNLWLPEPDVILHQVVGKLAEEASELAFAAARCMIQGIKESHPVTKKPNVEMILEEIADVQGMINLTKHFLVEHGLASHTQTNDEVFRRTTAKMGQKMTWLGMIRRWIAEQGK